MLAALVQAGAGVALLPVSIAAEQTGVVGLPLKPRLHRHVIALTRSTTQHDPAITSCLGCARDALTATSRA